MLTPEPEHKDFVAYYRVSTAKQGKSGLGLEGQVAAVEAFARSRNARLVQAYQEVESGKRADRPELLKAIGHANRSGLRLVIAKLDRLARNVAFTANLMETGVDFVAVDNPHANRFTIHILAAVAEHEAKIISERTKAGLAAYKTSGRVSKRLQLLYPDGVPPEIVEATAGKLGASLPQCRNLTPEARERGRVESCKRQRLKAVESYKDLFDDMRRLQSEESTLREIADWLNARGHTTRRGKPWNAVQVMRVLARSAPPPGLQSN